MNTTSGWRVMVRMAAVLGVSGPLLSQAAPTTLSCRYAPLFPPNHEDVTFTIKAENASGIKSAKLYIYEYDWPLLETCTRRLAGRWGLQKAWTYSAPRPTSINETYVDPGFPAQSFVSFVVEITPVGASKKKEYWGFAAGDWGFGNTPLPLWIKPPTKKQAMNSPALTTTSSFAKRRINIVFLAQEEAYLVPREVLPALEGLIFDGYHGTEAITRRKDLWAFHFSPEFGFTTAFNDPNRDIQVPPATGSATNLDNNAASIIHPSQMQDFTRGNFFGAEPDTMNSTLHELGHAVFNLADEYAGLNYDSSTDFHNNYSSRAACEAYVSANGWPTSDCREIQAGWWRPELSSQNCIMLHGPFSSAPQYGRSCLKRVDWIYNQLP